MDDGMAEEIINRKTRCWEKRESCRRGTQSGCQLLPRARQHGIGVTNQFLDAPISINIDINSGSIARDIPGVTDIDNNEN